MTRLHQNTPPATSTLDLRGRHYDRFFARRDSVAPGWFVFGRNPEYGDALVMPCAWPDAPPVTYKKRNGKVRLGWRTKGEAQFWADHMNAGTLAEAIASLTGTDLARATLVPADFAHAGRVLRAM